MPPDSRYLRQLDVLPPEKLAFPITVIGAGAIGSSVVMTLTKMGCSQVTVWDDDRLTDHNVSNQICTVDDVGMKKVVALQALVGSLSGLEIRIDDRRYKGQRLSGVVIVTTDNMKARADVWKAVKGKPDVPLLIDARMGMEFARIYTLRPTDADAVKRYEETLYPSEEAVRLPCSAKSIIYCPVIIGGLVAAQIKSHAVGNPTNIEILFDIPTLQLITDRPTRRPVAG